MKLTRTFSALATALAFCTVQPLQGAPDSTPIPSATVAVAVSTRPFPFKSVVVSVDKATRTFRMGKKVIRKVHVLPTTRVMKSDGTSATFEALTPGEEVRGAVRKRMDGDYDAVSVKIGPKPAAGQN